MISVIIPTHKRADLLFYELEHIYMQKDVDFEVIVVNDIEEEDETDVIHEKFPNVIYIKDSKVQGPSNKHKAGLKIAKGEYLYMPDDDDYLTDDLFFKKAVEIMKTNEKIAFVSGQCDKSIEFEDNPKNYIEPFVTNVKGYINGVDYLQEFQHSMNKPLSTVSTIYRKKAFDETDGINMIEMSDSSMYMQCLLWGDAYIMDDVVARYRIKRNSLTTTLSYDFILNVLKQKELLYYSSKNILLNPHNFWYNQYSLTFNFYNNGNESKTNLLRLLLWGFIHLHASKSLFHYLINKTLEVSLYSK